MIITTKRHGRTARDTRNLTSHLAKQDGQISRVVAIGNVPLTNSDDALLYMERMRDGSHADVAYHHITISPSTCLTDVQRDEAVERIMSAMDAEEHPFVLWEHSEKQRHAGDVDQHFHLVLGHVGPDGKALRDSGSYAKLEAVARSIEVDFGEQITPSRRTAAVASCLVEMGRDDVAQQLSAPDDLPRSSMTPGSRAAADRQGINLPAAQAAIKAAWEQSDGPSAFRSAVTEMGLVVAPGRKKGVFVVSAGDVQVGALDRIVKERRQNVAQKMEGYEHEPKPEKDVSIGHREGHESDLSAEPISERSSPAAAAAVISSGSAGGRRRDEPSRTPPGHSRSVAIGAAAAASGYRRSPRQSRCALETAQLNRALRTFDLSPVAKEAVAEIKVESFAGRFARFSSGLLNHELGRGALDRLWSLAYDVRDTITDVRLRIRFGKAQRHSVDPEPVRQVELSPAELIKKRDPEYGVTHVHVRPF